MKLHEIVAKNMAIGGPADRGVKILHPVLWIDAPPHPTGPKDRHA